jgi:hypothetical protein
MTETTNGRTRWESLEQWCPLLFIAGGVLFLIGGVNDTLIYFVGMGNPEAASVAFLMSGILVALLGLGGLYPRLGGRTQWLAQASLGSVVLAWAGVIILATLAVASLVLASFDLFASGLVAIVALPIGLLVVTAFLLFGFTVLRTDVSPRSVGGLLLIEAVLLILATVGAGAVESLVGRGAFLVGAAAGRRAVVVRVRLYLRRDERVVRCGVTHC